MPDLPVETETLQTAATDPTSLRPSDVIPASADPVWGTLADAALAGDWDAVESLSIDAISYGLESAGADASGAAAFCEALAAVIARLRAALLRERAQTSRGNSLLWLVWRAVPTVLGLRGTVANRLELRTQIGAGAAVLFRKATEIRSEAGIVTDDPGAIAAVLSVSCLLRRVAVFYFHDAQRIRDRARDALTGIGIRFWDGREQPFDAETGVYLPSDAGAVADSIGWDVTGQINRWWRYLLAVDLSRLPVPVLERAATASRWSGLTRNEAVGLVTSMFWNADAKQASGAWDTAESTINNLALWLSLSPEFAGRAWPIERPGDDLPVVTDVPPTRRASATTDPSRNGGRRDETMPSLPVLSDNERSVVATMRISRAAQMALRARRMVDGGGMGEIGEDADLRLLARQTVYAIRHPELWGATVRSRLRRFQTAAGLRVSGIYDAETRSALSQEGGISMDRMPPLPWESGGSDYSRDPDSPTVDRPVADPATGTPAGGDLPVLDPGAGDATGGGGAIDIRSAGTVTMTDLRPSVVVDSASGGNGAGVPGGALPAGASGRVIDYGPVVQPPRDTIPWWLYLGAGYVLGRGRKG